MWAAEQQQGARAEQAEGGRLRDRRVESQEHNIVLPDGVAPLRETSRLADNVKVRAVGGRALCNIVLRTAEQRLIQDDPRDSVYLKHGGITAASALASSVADREEPVVNAGNAGEDVDAGSAGNAAPQAVAALVVLLDQELLATGNAPGKCVANDVNSAAQRGNFVILRHAVRLSCPLLVSGPVVFEKAPPAQRRDRCQDNA